MSAQSLGEFELIERFFAPLSKTAKRAFGLKDDVALVDLSPGCELVAKTDAIVAGVHFRTDDPPALIGRKALRVNLSDLAAKGAAPLGFLQAITLNQSIDDDYLAAYAAGLAHDVEEFSTPLLGGDITAGPGPFTIAVTVLGELPRGTALLRAGAKAGDLLYVSGTIGDAALGLACLMGKLRLDPEHRRQLIARYHLPLPRLALGAGLRGLATASLDISDGLIADVRHMAAASAVSAVIERRRVPLSAAARAVVESDAHWWETILAGGDDYEIAFAVPPEHAAAVAGLATRLALPVTQVGRIEAGAGVAVVDDAGQPVLLSSEGYRHR